MKICLSAFFLAWVGALWCGCSTLPARPTASAKPNKPPAASTNALAEGQPGEEETEPSVVLPLGKGNPEALAHFAAGESMESTGRHDEAMEEFYKSVMADPGNERAAFEVAQWLLDQHHPERAVTLLSKVAHRPGASAPILSLLARADLQAGKTNAALAVSLQAIARQPDALQSYQSRLEVLVQTAKMAKALKTLDQAAKHIRNTPAQLIALANLYAACLGPQEKEKDPVRLRAVVLLDRAAAMSFSARELWERLADTYAHLSELKKAADIYNRLLAQAVDSATQDSVTLRDHLREKLGEILLDARDRTNAAAQFQAIVKEDPANYQGWYYLGILAHSEGKLAEAADDFGKARRLAPGLEQAYYRQALVLADQSRGDEALQVLDLARSHFPDSFDAQFFNALVNLQLKDFDEAVRHFSAAESMARSNNPARLDRQFYFQIGAACERGHQYKRAEDYLQRCVDMGPDDAEALNYLGFMWADRGEHLAKARAYIEKACKLEPKNAAYLDSMGWVLFKLNQPKEALPWLVKAVELSPEPDATILDHLGDVYLSLRQVGKAMENWRKSLAIEPNDDVKKKLQMLDAGAT
ncbi:MAG TPA: tetratricopeptide repeat protein [Candidatus Acidoferrum sp.]|nr:tetratricopeptide repeat protein [Candidatus Acidoferrum sp.]